MRITPLSVWTADVDDVDLHYNLIKSDCELSHSNPLVFDTCFVYSRTIAYLIRNAGDTDKFQKAFSVAVKLAEEKATSVYEN